MIRYPITKTQLEILIAAEDATWLQRAKDRTDGFRAKGFYDESSSIWSEIKTAAGKAKARATVDSVLNPQLRHLNCARNFRRLFDQDPIEAKAIYDGAVKLMSTIS